VSSSDSCPAAAICSASADTAHYQDRPVRDPCQGPLTSGKLGWVSHGEQFSFCGILLL
jgi:hypothetical protein